MSNDNFTLYTARDTSTTAFFRTVLTTSMGDKYHGIGSTEKESQVDAVRSYKKYESCRKPIKVTLLASDLSEQIVVMNKLIEQAKTEGLDGRLIAMANTDFERGFMALEKAMSNTGR